MFFFSFFLLICRGWNRSCRDVYFVTLVHNFIGYRLLIHTQNKAQGASTIYSYRAVTETDTDSGGLCSGPPPLSHTGFVKRKGKIDGTWGLGVIRVKSI